MAGARKYLNFTDSYHYEEEFPPMSPALVETPRLLPVVIRVARRGPGRLAKKATIVSPPPRKVPKVLVLPKDPNTTALPKDPKESPIAHSTRMGALKRKQEETEEEMKVLAANNQDLVEHSKVLVREAKVLEDEKKALAEEVKYLEEKVNQQKAKLDEQKDYHARGRLWRTARRRVSGLVRE
jgi:hypothetical protein